MRASTARIFAFALALVAAAPGWTAPVVYTVRTVASGRLGSVNFTDARLTISLRSDTRSTQTQAVNNSSVYSNATGVASVLIIKTDGTRIEATFRTGQIYARYDTQLGLVGFASPLGLAYPIIVGCFDPFICSDIGNFDGYSVNAHYDGIATQLADITANPGDSWSVTTETLEVPTNLSHSTLLTGYARSCSVAFASDSSCPAVPSKPLHTDHGDLFLSDMDPSTSGIFTVAVSTSD